MRTWKLLALGYGPLVNPYPLIYLKPVKSYPFGRSLPGIGHYREYPRAPVRGLREARKADLLN